jgi:arylsulfatase A-like enzyme
MGLVAAGVIAVIEGFERAWSLIEFVEGPLEPLGIFAMTIGYVGLVGFVIGGLGGVLLSFAVTLQRGIRAFPVWLWRVIWGSILGAAGGAWVVFALTLTARFDAVIARGPQLIAIAALAGALAGILWPSPALLTRIRENITFRIAAIVILFDFIVAFYAVNVLFAPQSSYGAHVLLDTAQLVLAFMMAWFLPRLERRSTIALAMVAGVALLFWVDYATRAYPRLEALVKIQGVTSRRAVDLLSEGLDFDRDGFAPERLVGGFDKAPLDPTIPGAILGTQRGQHSSLPAANQSTQSRARQSGRPNILLITIDALRADVMDPDTREQSILGELRPPTPTLDSLANRSAVFRATYSHASGTEDSFLSLFAGGLHPSLLLGVQWEGFLASRLRHSGYRTQAYCDAAHFPSRAWGWEEIDHRDGATDIQIREAVDFLAAGNSREPGFVWFHFMGIHAGVLNPLSVDSYLRQSHYDRYVRGLAAVDSSLAHLFAELRRRGQTGRTLIILSSDHGEELGEHGHYHHNLTLYEPAVRVPLWISGQGVSPGMRELVVPQVDLHPTILQTAGISAEPSNGESLWPLLRDRRAGRDPSLIYLFLPKRGFSRRYAVQRPEHGQVAVLDPVAGYKVIVRLDSETEEHFDLNGDPRERFNLAGQHLPWSEDLSTALDSLLAHWSGSGWSRAGATDRP